MPRNPEATIFLKKTSPGFALETLHPHHSLHFTAHLGKLVAYCWHLMLLWPSNPTLTKPLREHSNKLPKDLLLPAWRGSPFWQREPVHAALS